MRYSRKIDPSSCAFVPLPAHFRGAQGALLFAAHTFLPSRGSREGLLTRGAGAEPVGRLQVLDASGVLAGDVDSGGLRRRRVKPGLTGGFSVCGEDLGEHRSLLSPAWVRSGEGPEQGAGRAGPYLLGGREAGQGTQVGGVGDEHGLRKQARVGVLGHLRLVAVEGWPGGRRERGIKTWHPGPS